MLSITSGPIGFLASRSGRSFRLPSRSISLSDCSGTGKPSAPTSRIGRWGCLCSLSRRALDREQLVPRELKVHSFLVFGGARTTAETVPRSLYRVMVAGSATYCASLAVDYVRINSEVSEVTAGIDVVPERARLLPLVFDRKGISENTRPLLHAWGYYVVEKTTAPLLAHSASFPLMYKEVPSPRFTGIHLGTFSRSLATSSGFCGSPCTRCGRRLPGNISPPLAYLLGSDGTEI